MEVEHFYTLDKLILYSYHKRKVVSKFIRWNY